MNWLDIAAIAAGASFATTLVLALFAHAWWRGHVRRWHGPRA